jgi:hypothetical protein
MVSARPDTPHGRHRTPFVTGQNVGCTSPRPHTSLGSLGPLEFLRFLRPGRGRFLRSTVFTDTLFDAPWPARFSFRAPVGTPQPAQSRQLTRRDPRTLPATAAPVEPVANPGPTDGPRTTRTSQSASNQAPTRPRQPLHRAPPPGRTTTRQATTNPNPRRTNPRPPRGASHAQPTAAHRRNRRDKHRERGVVHIAGWLWTRSAPADSRGAGRAIIAGVRPVTTGEIVRRLRAPGRDEAPWARGRWAECR